MKELIGTLYDEFKTFDPIQIAEQLGIDIEYVDFLTNPKGQYIKLIDSPLILINQEFEYSEEKIFIVAHELYHALSHSDLIGYYNISRKTQSTMETEANKFAVNLLFELFIEEEMSLPTCTQEMNYKFGMPLEYGYLIMEGD